MTGSGPVLAWGYQKAFPLCAVHALSRLPQPGPAHSTTGPDSGPFSTGKQILLQ